MGSPVSGTTNSQRRRAVSFVHFKKKQQSERGFGGELRLKHPPKFIHHAAPAPADRHSSPHLLLSRVRQMRIIIITPPSPLFLKEKENEKKMAFQNIDSDESETKSRPASLHPFIQRRFFFSLYCCWCCFVQFSSSPFFRSLLVGQVMNPLLTRYHLDGTINYGNSLAPTFHHYLPVASSLRSIEMAPPTNRLLLSFSFHTFCFDLKFIYFFTWFDSDQVWRKRNNKTNDAPTATFFSSVLITK